jgi:glycine dehydrogenase subunit 2
MLMRAYHESRGERRSTIVIPDTAHGTNPASVTLAGYRPVAVRTAARGGVDLDDLRAKVDGDTAGLMLTNPNTLGVYDEEIVEVARVFHEAGALLYYDGANLNAVMGVSRPGDMGFDIVHINTHKSFSTPHGGGGPGAGPVACSDALERFLPVPRVRREDDGSFRWDVDRPESIGKVKGYWGNFGVLVRAYAYIRSLGATGLREASETAVLNANYLLSRLREAYELPFDRSCAHEFVLSARRQRRASDVRATDIAKRLMDYGFHPPTVYFPLLVEEALMIEPTETESRETLDRFADAMLRIAQEAEREPELLRRAPSRAPVGRLDEVRAVRQPILRQRERRRRARGRAALARGGRAGRHRVGARSDARHAVPRRLDHQVVRRGDALAALRRGAARPRRAARRPPRPGARRGPDAAAAALASVRPAARDPRFGLGDARAAGGGRAARAAGRGGAGAGAR